jgi:hypothetical protein
MAAQSCRTQAVINSRAHYMLSERYDRQRRWLGVPATAITAFVAGFTFAEVQGVAVYVIGGLATLGATLIAVQTFLNPTESARRHHAAGIEFGILRRKLDLLLIRGDGAEILTDLERLYSELDRLASVSPTIPDSVYEKARREIGKGS